MKNYRTTLVGAALAGLTFVSQFQANGGNLADWKLWVIPFLIAVLGYVAKDAGITGSIKLLAGCLALLTLPSCAGLVSTMTSPPGQLFVVTAESMAKQLAAAEEEKIVEQVILKSQAQITVLNAQGVNKNTAQEILRQSEILGLASVVTAAQQQYTGMTGHAYVLPKDPLAAVALPVVSTASPPTAPEAKQPLDIRTAF